MRSRRWLIAALAAAAILLLAGRGAATLYSDYLWFASMNATDVWRARTLTTIALRLLSALLAGAFVFANLWAVRQSVIALVLPRQVGNIRIGEEVPGRYLLIAVLILSVVFGALLSIPQNNWVAAELVLHGVAFGETDPFAQHDIGFFVYWLPFELSLFYWALFTVLLVTALVTFLYALTPSLKWERGSLYVSTYVRRHLTVLSALLLLTLAWSYRLDAYEVLLRGSGVNGAFVAIDHNVSIPANWGLAVFTMCAALLVLLAGWAGQVRVAFAAVTAVLVLSIVLRSVAPTLVQRFAAPGDPAARERPYVAIRGGYTRQAFAVSGIVPTDMAIGFDSLESAAYGVPLWDPAAIMSAVLLTPAAADSAATLGWRGSENGILAVVPQPPVALDPSTASPWSVLHLLSILADARGGIVRANAGGLASLEEASVAPVLVHPGAGEPVLVADTTGSLPAPGIEGGWRRVAYAWALQDFRVLAGDLPFPNPRLIMRRGVRERVRALAPFFEQGSTLFPVVHADTLFWMLELHSASSFYPLSEPIRVAGADRRYFQHAATAIVNATTGAVTFVPATALDPVARSWRAQFPSLFTPPEQVPPALLAARPPAVDAARAQADAFARAGTRAEPLPRRQVPFDFGADSAFMVEPEILFALPDDERLVWTLPVLDADERVVGLVAAIGGRAPRTLWRPLPDSELRWTTALEQLRRIADTATAAEREGALVFGRVRTVAFRDELALVQPVYSWPPRGSPRLLGVATSVGEEIRMAPTLAAVAGTPLAAVPLDATPVEFRTRVEALYESMRGAMRRGDWQAFGAAYDSLGALLGRPPR